MEGKNSKSIKIIGGCQPNYRGCRIFLGGCQPSTKFFIKLFIFSALGFYLGLSLSNLIAKIILGSNL